MTTYLHFDSLNREKPFIPKWDDVLKVNVWVPNDDYINDLTDSANDPTVRNFNNSDRISTATNYTVNGKNLSNTEIFQNNNPLKANAQIELCTVILPGNALCIRENKIQSYDIRNWYAVNYLNGQFIAVNGSYKNLSNISLNDDSVMTSPDGIYWKYQYTPPGLLWHDITFGNGLYVASGGKLNNLIMTSPDSIVWTLEDTSNISNRQFAYSVAFGNGIFVAVIESYASETFKLAMWSTDGIIWDDNTSTPLGTKGWHRIAYGNGIFVAITYDFTNNVTQQVMTSPDGVIWTLRTTPLTNKPWNNISFNNNLFVVVGSDNNIMTSPDGIVWSLSIITPATPLYNWTDVSYGNGVFVAVSNTGLDNTVLISSDNGATWVLQTISTVPKKWASIVFGNGMFVVTGSETSASNGRIMTSTDGINWVLRTDCLYIEYVNILNEPYIYVKVKPTNKANEYPVVSNNLKSNDNSSASYNKLKKIVNKQSSFIAWCDKTVCAPTINRSTNSPIAPRIGRRDDNILERQGNIPTTNGGTLEPTIDKSPNTVKWVIYKSCMTVNVPGLDIYNTEWEINIFDRFGNMIVIPNDTGDYGLSPSGGWVIDPDNPPTLNPDLQTTIVLGISPLDPKMTLNNNYSPDPIVLQERNSRARQYAP